MTAKRQITREDILPLEEYGRQRKQRRAALMEEKRNRRVPVGPAATFYFESYDTMWAQVHEMLWIEKGGDAQIADELAAYNPLIPQGDELVATLMFEIEDERRRRAMLARLGGVEEQITLQIGERIVKARPDMEDQVERTTEEGKTSSVHFLRFPFGEADKAAFRDTGKQAVLAVNHENYAHMAVVPEEVRRALLGDLA